MRWLARGANNEPHKEPKNHSEGYGEEKAMLVDSLWDLITLDNDKIHTHSVNRLKSQ